MLRDKDIREPLFDFLEEAYGKVRILEEKTMGKSRADVVMVTPNALCTACGGTYPGMVGGYHGGTGGRYGGLLHSAQAKTESQGKLEEKDQYFMEAGTGPYTGIERAAKI